MNLIDEYYTPRPDCQITGLQYVYAGVFGLKKHGTFVEVGSYDGVTYSNTDFLARLGWTGIYIDGCEEHYKRCVGNYKDFPNITVVHAMVGSGNDVCVSKSGELYCGDPDARKIFGMLEWSENVHTVTLDSILSEHNVPFKFDLLVIDVEGMEPEVLRNFNLMYWCPQMIIVETHEYHENVELRGKVRQIDWYVLSGNYVKIYSSEINTIYVRWM